MPRGFILHADPALDGVRQFTALPIRIGRSALNDLRVPVAVISDFHARIEENDGRICIVDLKSKNGTYVRASDGTIVKVPPSTPMNLAAFGNEFFLGPTIHVRLQVVEVAGGMPARSTMGTVLGNRNLLEGDRGSTPPPPANPASPYGPPPAYGSSIPPPPLSARHPAGYGANQPGWSSAPPSHRAAPSNDPMGTGHFALNMESLALVGLKELAASLVPSQQIRTTGDLSRLITKLHDAVEVFCRCFIPLREGHSQFISTMDLKRAASQRSMYRSQGYNRVEAARTPEEVAEALLDFRDRSLDSAAAIEGIFADLMVHQVALLEGVMRGVRALLEELSPENIEAAVDADSGKFSLAFGRKGALWQEYCARFEELAEEKQAFQRIFGPEFADAYREYRRKGDH